jgi:hypothetical protein
MKAEYGADLFKRTSGRLELHAVEPIPRPRPSPTGPRPGADESNALVRVDLQPDPLDLAAWGWTDVDFDAVGAPLCDDDPDVPRGDSHDPMHPGVVVLTVPDDKRQSLLVGTLSNARTHSLATDGCGVALVFEAWDGRCFSGHWDHAGIVVGGAGTFSLCAIR